VESKRGKKRTERYRLLDPVDSTQVPPQQIPDPVSLDNVPHLGLLLSLLLLLVLLILLLIVSREDVGEDPSRSVDELDRGRGRRRSVESSGRGGGGDFGLEGSGRVGGDREVGRLEKGVENGGLSDLRKKEREIDASDQRSFRRSNETKGASQLVFEIYLADEEERITHVRQSSDNDHKLLLVSSSLLLSGPSLQNLEKLLSSTGLGVAQPHPPVLLLGLLGGTERKGEFGRVLDRLGSGSEVVGSGKTRLEEDGDETRSKEEKPLLESLSRNEICERNI